MIGDWFNGFLIGTAFGMFVMAWFFAHAKRKGWLK